MDCAWVHWGPVAVKKKWSENSKNGSALAYETIWQNFTFFLFLLLSLSAGMAGSNIVIKKI